MPQATYHFPKGFLWGTATASHQVEGNNTNNNWHAWEEAGHTVHKSGLAADCPLPVRTRHDPDNIILAC